MRILPRYRVRFLPEYDAPIRTFCTVVDLAVPRHYTFDVEVVHAAS